MRVAERAVSSLIQARDQSERAVRLNHDQMILTGEPLAVLDLHHLSGPRMKRIEDPHLERRTPGIVTLSRAATGKSWLACAFGRQAARLDHSVLYLRMPRLFEDLAMARLDGRFPRLVDKLARVQLLILDDWGTHTLNDQQRLDLLEIFEERYRRKSTLITAQLPVAQWHDMIGEPTIADAILDRIIHNAHRIALEGDSMRRKKAARPLTDIENSETNTN